MAIGPVQLLVLGFDHPDFHGEVAAELERLRASDTVRVIDALAVHKGANGEIETRRLSNLTAGEEVELGSKIAALVGLGSGGAAGMTAGAEAGAAGAGERWLESFTGHAERDVLAEIPNDSAAALILIEHHWAVPLRNAIARAGGYRIGDRMIGPYDLLALGLATAEEAKDLQELERREAG